VLITCLVYVCMFMWCNDYYLLSESNDGMHYVQVAAAASHSSDLFEALSEIAPSEHYLQTNVVVPSGHMIGEHMM